MKIVGVAMIRNDADIVEPFVRHTLRLLDHLFVIVHCPQDGTDAILAALQAEGLPLTLVVDREPAFLQGERMTSLAREAWAAVQPDYAFPLDADELIIPAERGAVEAALAALPPGVPGARIRLRTYIPTAEDPPGEPNPVRRLRFRLREQENVTKAVLTRGFAADPALVIDHGNHGLLRIGARANLLPLPGLRPLALAHYPVRSAAQVTNKTIIGYLAHLAAGRHETEERRLATHWRRCYEEMILSGVTRGMTEEQLMGWFHNRPDLTLRPEVLVCDPVPAPDAMRYQHLARTDPYATLARFAEALIRARPGRLEGMRFDHAPQRAGRAAVGADPAPRR